MQLITKRTITQVKIYQFAFYYYFIVLRTNLIPHVLLKLVFFEIKLVLNINKNYFIIN